MGYLIEQISFVVPMMSICYILIITSTKLYIKIRKNFSIRVNCWFCNLNANVEYSQFNSWTCGSCQQYNGFDSDGDYNCDIPAQRSIQLNNRWKTGLNNERTSYVATTPKRNGLCETCNRNQEIKMQQLALFEPKANRNFHVEIEHYREKLEKSYELCFSCQRVVKKKLNRIMNNVLGSRLAQINAKGFQMLDRHVKVADSEKRITLNRIRLTTIIALSAWNLYNTSAIVNLSTKHLDSYFPPIVTHPILLSISYISAVKVLFMEYLTAVSFFYIDFEWINFNVTKDINYFLKSMIVNFKEVDFIINLVAVLLSLKLLLEKYVKRMDCILLMLLWNVNMLWPRIARSLVNELTGDILKIFIAIMLFVVTIVNSFSIEKLTPKAQLTNNSFHRIYSNCDEDLSENSDNESTFYSDSYSSSCSRKHDSSNSNNSFNTAKFSRPYVLRSKPRMFSSNDSTRSYRSDSQQSSYYQMSNPDSFNQNNTGQSYFSPDEAKQYSRTIGLKKSFRITDDCQNRLSDLNISGATHGNNNTITCSSPTSSILSFNQRRSHLLTPARLNFKGHSPLTAPATKTSWIAGGFFVKSNISPKKHIILSRTSSQSSGFESQCSAAYNGNTSGSRESFVDGDVVSNISKPFRFDSASQMDIDCARNSVLVTSLPRPNSLLPLLNQSTFIDKASCMSKPEAEANFYMLPYTCNNSLTLLPFSKAVFCQLDTYRQGLYDNESAFNKFSHYSRI